MKKLLTLLFIFTGCFVFSQSGYKHLNIAAGPNLEGDMQYSLALEINNGYYNSWDIIVETHLSEYINRKEELFVAGTYYKPLILKSNNLLFNSRIGLLVGRADSQFIIGGGGGFELTYTFPGQFAIMLQQNNHYFINVQERFRHSLNLGIKIPL